MAGGTDKYANVLTEKITMDSANTLTFEEVNIGLSLFDKAGILISRIEYQPDLATLAEMTANADSVSMAVVTSNAISNLAITQAAIVHLTSLNRVDCGTAAAGRLYQLPLAYDLSTLPGGGILITPRPWYIAMGSSGLANPGGGTIRFYFTVIKLTSENYFELLETRAYFG